MVLRSLSVEETIDFLKKSNGQKNSCSDAQKKALLEIKDISKIILEEEIPPNRLESALRGLTKKDGKYDHIIFEHFGKVGIGNLQVTYEISFKMIGFSYMSNHWISNFLVLRTFYPDDNYNPNPIYVRNPSFWRNNINTIFSEHNPEKKNDNDLKINFGTFFNRVELTVNAEEDFAAEEKIKAAGEADSKLIKLYKLPSAVGYRLEGKK